MKKANNTQKYLKTLILYAQIKWQKIQFFICMLRTLERKYLNRFEMWCWRRMEEIKWSEKVTDDVL